MARQSEPLTELILELLREKHLMTAPQIVESFADQGTHYNKTSVYRALEKLLAQNEICKLNLGKNDIQFELRSHHHDHLVCTSCGNITSVERNSDTDKQIGNFKVDHHHATYFGECEHCQLKNATNN